MTAIVALTISSLARTHSASPSTSVATAEETVATALTNLIALSDDQVINLSFHPRQLVTTRASLNL
jgi:hypothetical protein